MKSKITFILALAAIVVFAAGTVWAGDIYVDIIDVSCVSSPQGDPYSVVYCNIQDAIDDAAPSDTINVAAGTYINDIWDSSLGVPDGYRITKSVTLLGAQAGNDPAGSTDRGGESILVRTNGTPYSLFVSNITIDGFTFTSGGGSGGGRLIIADDADNVTIRNCIIKDISGTDPHGLYIYPGAESAVVSSNTFSNTAWEAIRCDGNALISNNTIMDIPSNKGIFLGGSSDSQVMDNVISNAFYEGIQTYGTATITGNEISGCYKGIQTRDSASGTIIANNYVHDNTWEGIEAWVPATITRNEISGCYKGINLSGGAGGSTVSGNTISNTTYEGIQAFAPATIVNNEISGCWHGIQIRNHDTGTVIDFNSIHDNTYHGIEIPNYGGLEADVTSASITNNLFAGNGYTGIKVGGGTDVTGIEVHYNNFLGNGIYGVENQVTDSSVSATCNWWGDASGPTHAANPGGTGDAVTDNVDYDPLLTAIIYYGDVTLSGDFQKDHFPEVWDLTACDCDLVIRFRYDANGLVDDLGAHAWAEFGVREVGYGDFNPTSGVEGAGVWLSTDYDWTADTFDPDPAGAPILDLDDKLILQKGGGLGEGSYNLPSAPPNPLDNHRIWWDRDGVDPWQSDDTANTGGIYNIEIRLHATSPTSGQAYMKINGLYQGFETDGNWKTIELTPAGMTFTGDMTHMQVFYGLYGYGATHSVTFEDITVSGCLLGDLDCDGDVDRDDLKIILSHRNQPANKCPECDLDGDGMITALDARKLVLLCTRPRCATE